jgi:hypothetical protein
VTLEHEIQTDVMEGVRRCKAFGYNPAYFLRMVAEHGAVGAAKLLLEGDWASDGFTRLWVEGHLDLSVEFLVLHPKYESLFTADERAEARRRLVMYGFDVDRHFAAHSPYSSKRGTAPTPSTTGSPPTTTTRSRLS